MWEVKRVKEHGPACTARTAPLEKNPRIEHSFCHGRKGGKLFGLLVDSLAHSGFSLRPERGFDALLG